MNVLYLAAEADPFIKVGGLGDVAGTLPVAINQTASSAGLNIEVRVVIPFHPSIKADRSTLTRVGEYSLTTKIGSSSVEVYSKLVNGTLFYLLDAIPIRQVAWPYSRDQLADGEKYVFFSLAALRLPDLIKWPVDILHANDWHTAIAVHAIRTMDLYAGMALKTVLSVHNLPYMGNGIEPVLSKYGIPEASSPCMPQWGRFQPLPMGLAASDMILPVSPGYASEIMTSDYGCGLEDMLTSLRPKINGIINGIDENAWNPSSDKYIPYPFDKDHLTEKKKNKAVLQQNLNLPVEPAEPVVALISRLDYQKGVDLFVEAAYKLSLPFNFQVIILGTGDPYIEMKVRQLQTDKPDRVRGIIEFDQQLSHLIYAGADIFVMPSRYEPCGISQMIAQRYGTIPVARATGGLRDTIVDSGKTDAGTGYLFDELSPVVLAGRLTRALSDFRKNAEWQAMQKRAMSLDFSWNRSAMQYIGIYQTLVDNKSNKKEGS